MVPVNPDHFCISWRIFGLSAYLFIEGLFYCSLIIHAQFNSVYTLFMKTYFNCSENRGICFYWCHFFRGCRKVCIVATGVVGDLCRALEKDVLPYTQHIMGWLMVNLEGANINR